jgi:Fe-S cluster biogenesis protein NfuA
VLVLVIVIVIVIENNSVPITITITITTAIRIETCGGSGGQGAVEDREVRQRVAHTEALLLEIESLPDAEVRSTAAEAVQGLLELYGEALARIVESASRRGGESILEAFAADELVSHLLLLHGLHPVDLETRVRGALKEVRPYLESHGGNVELLGVEGGVARLRLQGSCSGCPSSAVTLEHAIEEALQKAAPDLEGIEAVGEGGVPVPAARSPAERGHAARGTGHGCLVQIEVR